MPLMCAAVLGIQLTIRFHPIRGWLREYPKGEERETPAQAFEQEPVG
jgi:hypothetical protein